MFVHDDKQEKFLKDPFDDSILIGDSGTGKTKCITKKIIDDNIQHTKYIVIFNKKPFFKTELNVKTYHELTGYILQKLENTQCCSENISLLSAVRSIKKHQVNILRKTKCLRKTRIIIADDCQNISQLQYDFLLTLKNKLGIKLILVGCISQTSNIDYIITYHLNHNTKKYILTKNYRMSPEIETFSNNFKISAEVNSKINLLEANLPTIYCNTKTKIFTKILNIIKKSNDRHNIAIIGTHKKYDSNNLGLSPLSKYLEENDIECVKHYELEHCCYKLEKNKINLFTIYNINEIEFDKIILLNFHYNPHSYNDYKMLFYNAITRAKNELFICVNNEAICYKKVKYCNIQGYTPTYPVCSNTNEKISKKVSNLTNKYFKDDDFDGLYQNLEFTETTYKLYQVKSININKSESKQLGTFIKSTLKYYSDLFNNVTSTDNIQPTSQYTDILENHINKIKRLALLTRHCTFFKNVSHPNLKIYGIIDMLFEDTIIFLKFGNVSIVDKINSFLLFHCYHNKWNTKLSFEIWDLNSGTSYIISFKNTLSNFDISLALSLKFNIKMENLIFVYDLETTGLNVKSCEIIERHFHEITHNTQISNGVIKPYKYVPPIVLSITGITKKELRNGEQLSLFKSQIKLILDNSVNPIFIAHNGNVFDHKIMKKQFILNDKCKFLDSRMVIRQLSDIPIKNESLSEIYKKILGKKFSGKAHRAKEDVIMLLHIFNKLGITEETFLLLT